MKRILILSSLLVLSAIVCLATQNADPAMKQPTAHLYYKTFQLNYVKGSIEEVPLTDHAPEIRTTKLITQNEHIYLVSLRSFLPPFTLYARPPPE